MNTELKSEIDAAIKGRYNIAIFQIGDEILAGGNVAESYNGNENGYLCSVDLSHDMDDTEVYGEDWTVYDMVQDQIGQAQQREQERKASYEDDCSDFSDEEIEEMEAEN